MRDKKILFEKSERWKNLFCEMWGMKKFILWPKKLFCKMWDPQNIFLAKYKCTCGSTLLGYADNNKSWCTKCKLWRSGITKFG